MLSDDPNNVRAFRALAEIVRRRAQNPDADGDPLTAPADETEVRRAADLAVWALSEELAGNPRAWYPLIELARLSVLDDREGTLRRLITAAERDPSGHALAEGLAVLREAHLPVEALGLGVGHWRPHEHTTDVGRELVLASLEAGRPFEAKQHLRTLEEYSGSTVTDELRESLAQAIAASEDVAPGV